MIRQASGQADRAEFRLAQRNPTSPRQGFFSHLVFSGGNYRSIAPACSDASSLSAQTTIPPYFTPYTMSTRKRTEPKKDEVVAELERKKQQLKQYSDDDGHFSLVRCVSSFPSIPLPLCS